MAFVADRLYLSYRLRGFTESNMVRHFERMLRAFPFSRLATTGLVVRVQAVSASEPSLYEQAFDKDTDLDSIVRALREYMSADCAAEVDGYWDLWQYDREWRLAPSGVTLVCLGPAFERESDDHLRIDLGIDTLFLPQPDLPNHMFMAQSNIRSLLHLVADLDGALSGERRRLWTESGENFAEKAAALVDESRPGPRLVK